MHDRYARAGNVADPPYLAPEYHSTRVRAPSQPLIVIHKTDFEPVRFPAKLPSETLYLQFGTVVYTSW